MAGIYIHIPFCKSKCIYCGFYSVRMPENRSAYLDALKREMLLRMDYLSDVSYDTLYFGGGTPSLLDIAELADLLDGIVRIFPLSADAEITLEANPEQLTLQYCKELRMLGVNRLSIGIQSFCDEVLQFMGRRHTAAEALAAVNNAANAGFGNISVDLIYGVSERNDVQWVADVKQALSMPVQHLSCYALTPEENSILYRRIKNCRHAPVDDDLAARQYDALLQTLAGTPMKHYEVSNFSLPAFESKHNSAYWDHTPYLGLGPAAHSFDGNSRQWNPANLARYLKNVEAGVDCEERESLSDDDLFNETVLLRLRTCRGVDLDEVAKRFGTTRKKGLMDQFGKHYPAYCFEKTENRLRLTDAGMWFADGIAADLFV